MEDPKVERREILEDDLPGVLWMKMVRGREYPQDKKYHAYTPKNNNRFFYEPVCGTPRIKKVDSDDIAQRVIRRGDVYNTVNIKLLGEDGTESKCKNCQRFLREDKNMECPKCEDGEILEMRRHEHYYRLDQYGNRTLEHPVDVIPRGDSKYICSECMEEFDSIDDVKGHLACPDCGSTSITESVQVVHREEREYDDSCVVSADSRPIEEVGNSIFTCRECETAWVKRHNLGVQRRNT